MPLRATTWSGVCLGLALLALSGCKGTKYAGGKYCWSGLCRTPAVSCVAETETATLPSANTYAAMGSPTPVRDCVPPTAAACAPRTMACAPGAVAPQAVAPQTMPTPESCTGTPHYPGPILAPEPEAFPQFPPAPGSGTQEAPNRLPSPPRLPTGQSGGASSQSIASPSQTYPVPAPPGEDPAPLPQRIPRIAARETGTYSDAPVQLLAPEPYEEEEFDDLDTEAEETPIFRRRTPASEFPQPSPIPARTPAIDVPVPDPDDIPSLQEQSAIRRAAPLGGSIQSQSRTIHVRHVKTIKK